MESYIVRVIRRGQIDRDRGLYMEGVVESVESRGQAVFHNATELWAILAGTGRVANNDTKQPELQNEE